jgi:hypothetical protein
MFSICKLLLRMLTLARCKNIVLVWGGKLEKVWELKQECEHSLLYQYFTVNRIYDSNHFSKQFHMYYISFLIKWSFAMKTFHMSHKFYLLNATTCSQVKVNRYFKEKYYLHLQGQRVNKASKHSFGLLSSHVGDTLHQTSSVYWALFGLGPKT